HWCRAAASPPQLPPAPQARTRAAAAAAATAPAARPAARAFYAAPSAVTVPQQRRVLPCVPSRDCCHGRAMALHPARRRAVTEGAATRRRRRRGGQHQWLTGLLAGAAMAAPTVAGHPRAS